MQLKIKCKLIYNFKGGKTLSNVLLHKFNRFFPQQIEKYMNPFQIWICNIAAQRPFVTCQYPICGSQRGGGQHFQPYLAYLGGAGVRSYIKERMSDTLQESAW